MTRSRSRLVGREDHESCRAVRHVCPSTRPTGSAWRIVADGTTGSERAHTIVDHTITYAELRCGGDTLTAFPAALATLTILDSPTPGVHTPDQIFDLETFVGKYQERTGTKLARHVNA